MWITPCKARGKMTRPALPELRSSSTPAELCVGWISLKQPISFSKSKKTVHRGRFFLTLPHDSLGMKHKKYIILCDPLCTLYLCVGNISTEAQGTPGFTEKNVIS